MKKTLVTMLAAAVALGVCMTGCNKGGETKKDGTKTEAPAAGEAAKPADAAAPAAEAPASGAAAYGDEICKAAMTDPAKMMKMISISYMTRLSIPEAQEKAMPKEQFESMIKQAEEAASKGMDEGMKSDPADKPTDCKVIDSKDVACDEVYTKIDTEGAMGQKFTPGRAKSIGDLLKVDSCGIVTLSAKSKGKDEKIAWGVGKINGAYAILTGFQVK